MPDAVIVSAKRTPIGRAHEVSLAGVRPGDLAALIVAEALAAVPQVDPGEVEDLILGCGLPGGEQGMNMARIVAVALGHDGMPGTTVTRCCSSSLQTTRMAFHAIRAGEGRAFVSGGVESVSSFARGSADLVPGQDPQTILNPLFRDAGARTARLAADGEAWHDPREDGLLPDAYIAMGQTAEHVAGLRGVSRERQDEYAALSQNRAEAAIADGVLAREITPVTTPDGLLVEVDAGPRPGVAVDALAGLRPVFREHGTVTAGNACPLNDGAAALVIVSDDFARERGLTPLARIVSTAVTPLSPEIMGLGPVEASRRALRQAGMTIDDVDLVEIDEAFAAQVIPCAADLGVEWDRLNVHGGAIALGHPFGMTGARITATLLNALTTRDAVVGLETTCVGGGQGMAMV